jgi:hypothetical protein
MFDKYKLDWKNRVSAYSQGNKLRTYKLLKHDFCTEPYLDLNTLKFILSCSIIEHLAQCLSTVHLTIVFIYAGFQTISPAIASFFR